ncbi:ATP-dependent serine peptidase containing a PDZ domain protein [Agromyces sp. Root81]|uniref:YlbL family protein n=1 Tax=Agromyces sp. Root81 TaxID=1736601 RepID=UPI0006FA17E6|nr:PDZ domain-containing protein [Agromyces sp. Root81]KRC58590.1 ATP-dependent serine peptidase containing a PDZ domain protein [Agromyces sp. Root81]
MSIFDETPLSEDSHRRSDPTNVRRPLRERIGWSAITVAVVVGIVFALMPSPYVIEQPGPVYDTLGVAENSDEEEVPLIEIPDETTYPTDGELNLLTVSVVGRPGKTPSWFEVIAAWFDRTRSVVPVEAIFPPGVSTEDRDAQNQAAMVDSQQDAIAAALVELGYDFPREVTIAGLLEDSPAVGVLEEGDVIVSLDGTEVHSIRELQTAVREHGSDAPAQIEIIRDGAPLTVEATPVDRDGVSVLGIGVRMNYEFPVEVELQLDNVGGPSAGMMFALGIVDKLTPGAMTGGQIVAGTGTIDSSGDVGPIGGIRQKLWGAEDAGAAWFLAPEANCDEVTGNVPSGLTVFSVSTLDQAREIVEDVADGEVTGSYPSCPA